MKQREIKFRAWDKACRAMYLPDTQPGPVFYLNGCLSLDQTWVTRDFVLMQYTGVKDKNGKEIYEGDILSHVSGDGQGFLIVQWNEYEPGWEMRDIGPDGLGFTLDDDMVRHCSVYGNIFQNPELIEP